MTTFTALPHDLFAFFEDALHFNIVEKLEEAFFMSLFNSSDSTKSLSVKILPNC